MIEIVRDSDTLKQMTEAYSVKVDDDTIVTVEASSVEEAIEKATAKPAGKGKAK